jgi:two-component system, OmpR family, sensor kinase
MTGTWFSLRRRLLILLLGGSAVCWLAVAAWSYVDARHEIDELFDAQLAQTAQALLAQRHRLHRDHDDEDGDHDREPPLQSVRHPYQARVMFQIWHADGTLVARSAGAPPTPLTARDGYSNGHGSGGSWRYYSQWDGRHLHRVEVAEDQHDRRELSAKIALRLALPMVVILPLLGFWLWIATRRGLRPLDAAAGEIAMRQPEHLNPILPAHAPIEIRPLIESINQLFARVERTLETERRFTADAAHELRTPLAALAAQAQVVLRARDDDERRHALEQLIASSRRAARLVDQLLTLARLDPAEAPSMQPVPLDRLAEEICALHGAPAVEKNVTLALDAEPVTVAGDGDALRILLRNLVDNAIRYTPEGGQVTVAIRAGVLTVTDTGPGIPPEERQRVFDRFRRLAGQATEGSGLGLSIVARVAERHGAGVELGAGDDGKGLRVTVRFPVSGPRAPGAAS